MIWRRVLSANPGAGGALLASPSCGEHAHVPTQWLFLSFPVEGREVRTIQNKSSMKVLFVNKRSPQDNALNVDFRKLHRRALKIPRGKRQEGRPVRRSRMTTAMLSKGDIPIDQSCLHRREFDSPEIFLSKKFVDRSRSHRAEKHALPVYPAALNLWRPAADERSNTGVWLQC